MSGAPADDVCPCIAFAYDSEPFIRVTNDTLGIDNFSCLAGPCGTSRLQAPCDVAISAISFFESFGSLH